MNIEIPKIKQLQCFMGFHKQGCFSIQSPVAPYPITTVCKYCGKAYIISKPRARKY